MEKSELSKLLLSNSARITYEDNNNAASSAWNNYVIVVVDGKFSNHIKCVKCDTLLKRKHRDGTSGLRYPPPSTPSERAYSLAGCTLEERRTQLSTSSVDNWEKFHLVELNILLQNSSKTTKKFFTFDVSTSIRGLHQKKLVLGLLLPVLGAIS